MQRAALVRSAKELIVYRKGYELAMQVFLASKQFPNSERFALTDQCRRSSRSVCANLREAWAKRRYPAHFLSKLTDADAENSETDCWLDFARDCGYLTVKRHQQLAGLCTEVGAMLGSMMRSPHLFLLKPPADP